MARSAKPSYWRNFEFGSTSGGLELEQIDRRHFLLLSDITYTGESLGFDVGAANEAVLRSVPGGATAPGSLGPTDLASVPAPFRWWASRYGVHTPAALIHDRFIGKPHRLPGLPSGVSEQQIDTYFRTMLRYSDVPFLRRWLMWAAVASRTRLLSGGLKAASMIVWVALAFVGVWMLTWGLIFGGPGWAILFALFLPAISALLWWHQWGAGLIIAYVGVPLLLPPALLAVPLLLAFALVESAFAEGWQSVAEEFGDPLQSGHRPHETESLHG